MIRQATLIAVIVSMLLFFVYTPTAATGNGSIQGQVINMTPEGGPVGEITVTLHTYMDNAETATATAITDSEGRFEFTSLDTESDYQYDLGLIYQEAEYYSDLLQFEAGETTKSIEMNVYNATTSDEAITAHAWHITIFVEQDSLWVMEDFILANWGDETYIGPAVDDGREAIRFSLPEGAREIELTYGFPSCCTRISDHSITSSRAFPPGSSELGFSYRLAYSPPAYLLSRVIDYYTDTLTLHAEDTGNLRLTIEQLRDTEPVVIEDGTHFLQFVGEDLAAGSGLTISISTSPNPTPSPSISSPRDYQSAFKWVGVAFATIAVGFCLGYPTYKRRLAGQGIALSEREALLQEMAQLDDDFEAGRLSAEEYNKLRSQKKARLIVIDQRWRKDERKS